MSLIKMPEGVELDLKVYLVGMVEDLEVEIVLTVGGLPAFSDDILKQVDLPRIIKSNNLDDMGSGWRIMNREQIADYKAREREAEENAAP